MTMTMKFSLWVVSTLLLRLACTNNIVAVKSYNLTFTSAVNDINKIIRNKNMTPLLEQPNQPNQRKLQRGKRYLDFNKGSRMSWRTTVKNNILKINTLWGYGFGMRTNFPFPDKKDRLRPFFKRDLLHAMEDMLDGHGLDGRACILKAYCTVTLEAESNISEGILFKLLNIFFRFSKNDKQHFPYLQKDYCAEILHSHCPLGFDSISPYTDDV